MKNIQQIDTIHIISLTPCYTLFTCMQDTKQKYKELYTHKPFITHQNNKQWVIQTKFSPYLMQKVKGTNLPKEEKTYYHVIMLKFLQSIEKIKVIITWQHARQHDKQGIDKKHEEKIKVHTRFFRHTHTP